MVNLFRTQPWATAGLWVLAALLLNGVIFGLGWNDPAIRPSPAWAPPGYVVGGVWLVLFTLVGLVQGRLWAAENSLHHWVMVLLLACLAYPFYTAGLQAGAVAWGGTVVTLFFTCGVLWQLRNQRTESWLLLPLVAWLSFASVLTWATWWNLG